MTRFTTPHAKAMFTYGDNYGVSQAAHSLYGFMLAPKTKTTAAYFHGPEEVYEPVTVITFHENTLIPSCPVIVERKNGERIRTTISHVDF